MQAATRTRLDLWWSALFGLAEGQLWREVTVLHPHGRLGDYPGWYVAWRDTGVHVSAPSSAGAAEVAFVRDAPVADLQEPEWWRAFARRRGLTVLGPTVHHVLDRPPVLPDLSGVGVLPVDARLVGTLRARVSDADWEECGLSRLDDAAEAPVLGVVRDGVLVAAVGLDDWDDAPRDVDVLVAPEHRGGGLATLVGGHAASYAVSRHGRARWCAQPTNVASTRAALRLGFEPVCIQLALRPPRESSRGVASWGRLVGSSSGS